MLNLIKTALVMNAKELSEIFVIGEDQNIRYAYEILELSEGSVTLIFYRKKYGRTQHIKLCTETVCRTAEQVRFTMFIVERISGIEFRKIR